MFKSILVPVDIAEVEVAQPGVDEAVELAKAGGAALRPSMCARRSLTR
jgi:hypothetical protein